LAQDHYKTLGVPYDATHQEIKKAFHSLALRYHPDVTQLDKAQAEEWFKLITTAYWILKDPMRRREYNRTLPASTEEIKVIHEEKPPWERQKEEEWIWDERQLRYRKKITYGKGMHEARSPFSFLGRGRVDYPKPSSDEFGERFQDKMLSFQYWFVRRVRIARLRYRLFLDWVNKRRLYTWRRKRSYRRSKTGSN
jgi:curved DNA-binding protein CbpA